MRKWSLAVLAVVLGAGACLADTPEPSKFYKLEFVVKEVDAGRVLNSRAYTTTTSSNSGGCSIRTSSRVPGPPTVNVGIDIDCAEVREVEGGLSMTVSAEVNSIPPESPQGGGAPIFRQNKWRSTLFVPLKKAIVIFSSDDVSSKHQMQVELTATPIK